VAIDRPQLHWSKHPRSSYHLRQAALSPEQTE
jgi:hypothetical protein